MKLPRLSIVIVSKNDQGLAETLTALRHIDSPLAYEVVVIDASAGKLEAIHQAFPTVTWVDFPPVLGKSITIPEQRNRGVAEANGDIIAFTDANCIPAKGWLSALLHPILQENESIVAGTTTARGAGTVQVREGAHRHTKYIRECPTINLAFTRELFDKIGGFDTRFDYGSDVDFSWRVNDAGYKVRFAPTAKVSHDWGNTSENIRRSYLYGVARARLYKKHPSRWRELLTHDSTAIIYPLFILGLPLTWWFWPYPFLILIPFVKNISHRPLLVLQKHFVYAFGVLREVVRV